MNEKIESGLEVVAWAHPDYCDVITDSPTRTIEWERRGVSPITLVRQSDAERALSERDAEMASLRLAATVSYKGGLAGIQHGGFLSLTCPECHRTAEAFTMEGLVENWNKPPAPSNP